MFLLNICVTWLEKCNATSMKTVSFEIKLTTKSMWVTSGTLVENPDNTHIIIKAVAHIVIMKNILFKLNLL